MTDRLMLCALLALGLVLGGSVEPATGGTTNSFDAAAASMETLVFHVQRFGSTPAKKQARKAAKQELVARGANALESLMRYAHIDNGGIQQQIFELAWTHLPEEQAVPVLMCFADEQDLKTRKMAIFLLGKFTAPAGAETLLPSLDVDKTAGATMRTLGKWGYEPARQMIERRLEDENERRRILAVTALRDIGNPESLPLLIGVLSDPIFTVRKAAQRAIVAFGASAERPVLDALPTAGRVSKRELLGILGEIGGRRGRRALRAELKSDDNAIRRDAARGLERMERRWLK